MEILLIMAGIALLAAAAAFLYMRRSVRESIKRLAATPAVAVPGERIKQTAAEMEKQGLDVQAIADSLDRYRERRARLLLLPPAPLEEGAIATTGYKRKGDLVFVDGQVGDDTIQACVNMQPNVSIVSFWVNGPAPAVPFVRYPFFNLATGEFHIFQEDLFMKSAVQHWLNEEVRKLKNERSRPTGN